MTTQEILARLSTINDRLWELHSVKGMSFATKEYLEYVLREFETLSTFIKRDLREKND